MKKFFLYLLGIIIIAMIYAVYVVPVVIWLVPLVRGDAWWQHVLLGVLVGLTGIPYGFSKRFDDWWRHDFMKVPWRMIITYK